MNAAADAGNHQNRSPYSRTPALMRSFAGLANALNPDSPPSEIEESSMPARSLQIRNQQALHIVFGKHVKQILELFQDLFSGIFLAWAVDVRSCRVR